jgi:peptide-methionine (S)-S-oxide reductase
MKIETITLAGGCFWCTEAIFKRLKGVSKVTPGYSGGFVEKPTYRQVSDGRTGHTEAIQVEFDPQQMPLTTLLEIFFKLHDPTTPNQQGNDIGPQYRSAIFYNTEEQKQIAEQVKKELEDSKHYKSPIVTEITKFTNFYPAEDYHQNYYETHKDAPYCRVIIDPKVKKLLEQFSAFVKAD